MEKQRTLFYDPVPAETPKKRGTNKPVADRRIQRVQPGDIDVRFTNTTVTQFGGYPLWAKFCEGIGLSAKLAHHIKMQRGIATLHRRILNVCGSLKRRGKRRVPSLPEWWPWQETYAQLAVSHGLSPP